MRLNENAQNPSKSYDTSLYVVIASRITGRDTDDVWLCVE